VTVLALEIHFYSCTLLFVTGGKTVGILRIDHGTSTFAQLTATAGLGTTLPGHEKGGIEDDILKP